MDDEEILRVQRIMAKHPSYVAVGQELSRQANKLSALLAAREFTDDPLTKLRLEEHSLEASLLCAVLSETKRRMEADVCDEPSTT